MQIKNQSRFLSLRFSSALGSLVSLQVLICFIVNYIWSDWVLGFFLCVTRSPSAVASTYVKTSGSLISVLFCFSADDFTLEKIIELGLDQFAEQISEVSAAASKELSIEQVWISFYVLGMFMCRPRVVMWWKSICPKRLYNGNYNTLHYFTFELLRTKGIFYMLRSTFLTFLRLFFVRLLQALLRAGSKLPWILDRTRIAVISDSSTNLR